MGIDLTMSGCHAFRCVALHGARRDGSVAAGLALGVDTWILGENPFTLPNELKCGHGWCASRAIEQANLILVVGAESVECLSRAQQRVNALLLGIFLQGVLR